MFLICYCCFIVCYVYDFITGLLFLGVWLFGNLNDGITGLLFIGGGLFGGLGICGLILFIIGLIGYSFPSYNILFCSILLLFSLEISCLEIGACCKGSIGVIYCSSSLNIFV